MAREFNIVFKAESADVSHDVIGAVGRESSKTCFFKFGQNQIAARAIVSLQLIVVSRRQRQSVRARGLQWRGCAYGQEVVHLANRARYFRACDTVTNTPTGDRIRFR